MYSFMLSTLKDKNATTTTKIMLMTDYYGTHRNPSKRADLPCDVNCRGFERR